MRNIGIPTIVCLEEVKQEAIRIGGHGGLARTIREIVRIGEAVVVGVRQDEEAFVRKMIRPLIEWIDPSFDIIRITSKLQKQTEKLHCPACYQSGFYSKEQAVGTKAHKGALAPAISIMIFLSEFGSFSYQEIRGCLQQSCWKFHHKIELMNKRTPNFNVARQEYFHLADCQPLWSVNPVHGGNEHLRICIFTQNFQEMVDFYRLVTDQEMESTKPGFCTFVLQHLPGLHVQLTLKYSQNLRPYALESTFLVFQMKDVRALRPIFPNGIAKVNDNVYSLLDPDGNKVILVETRSQITNQTTRPENNRDCTKFHQLSIKHSDAFSESQDSGRWSNNGTDISYINRLQKLDSSVTTKYPDTSGIESDSHSSFHLLQITSTKHFNAKDSLPQRKPPDEIWL